MLGTDAERVRLSLIGADRSAPAGSYNNLSLQRALAEAARFTFKPPAVEHRDRLSAALSPIPLEEDPDRKGDHNATTAND